MTAVGEPELGNWPFQPEMVPSRVAKRKTLGWPLMAKSDVLLETMPVGSPSRGRTPAGSRPTSLRAWGPPGAFVGGDPGPFVRHPGQSVGVPAIPQGLTSFGSLIGAGIDAVFETRFTWATLPVVRPPPPTSEIVTAIPARESVSVVPEVGDRGHDRIRAGLHRTYASRSPGTGRRRRGDRAGRRRRAVAPVDRRDEAGRLGLRDRRRRTWWSGSVNAFPSVGTSPVEVVIVWLTCVNGWSAALETLTARKLA